VAQVASGEIATIGEENLPVGTVRTASGRLSAVTEPGELSVHYPFTTKQLVILDDALKYGSRGAKARFAVYLGDLGDDTAATAREILASVPTPDNAVLFAEPARDRGGLRQRRQGPRHRRGRPAGRVCGGRVLRRG
jgi:hypothetical protein